MSDMRLSYIFFAHIRAGSRLVLVGDVDQLPSVGPGNVFRELVQCGVIPVTVLDTIFRQAEGSRIIANAKRMQENNAALDYGAGFSFIPAGSAAEAAEKVQELYRASVDAFGMDKVQVLTPYRKTGEASVNVLNERLWEMVNPKEEGKPEIRSGKRTFRLGDRIIHNKNKNQISNGDIGYIKNIYVDEDGSEAAELEFSEGRFVKYGSEELDMVEHAYATTVHKSQGSEYPMVILPWLLGCPAIVVIGDSLAKPFPHPDNEVWCTLFYYLNHWRFASGEAGERQEDSGVAEEQGMAAVTLEHPPENVRLIEGADGQLMLCMETAS